jgi:cytosine/uracil/thiamine/allantoin permease
VHGGRRSPFWHFTGARRYAWLALVVGMVTATLCISVPKYTGPIAKALNDTDLSWLAAPILAALIYFFLARSTVRSEVAHRRELIPSANEIDADEAFGTGAEHGLFARPRPAAD